MCNFCTRYGKVASVGGSLMSSTIFDTASVSWVAVAGLVEEIILPTKTYNLAAGEEVDTGFTRFGLYLVRTTSIGHTGIILVGTGPGSTIIYGESTTFVSDFDSTSSKFAINRKVDNGNIFVKNISTITRQFQIKQMKIY